MRTMAAQIGGLTTKTNYYVIRVDDDTFQLALSDSDAEDGTAIDFTSAGNDSQTFKINHEISLDAGATNADVVAAINAGSD